MKCKGKKKMLKRRNKSVKKRRKSAFALEMSSFGFVFRVQGGIGVVVFLRTPLCVTISLFLLPRIMKLECF